MYQFWSRHQIMKKNKHNYHTNPKANKTYKIFTCVSHCFYINKQFTFK